MDRPSPFLLAGIPPRLRAEERGRDGVSTMAQYRISPTRIRMFRRCPRRWWFDCVAGLSSPDSEAAARGTAIHAAIEFYLLTGKLPANLDPDVAGVLKAGLGHLPKPPLPKMWIEVPVRLVIAGVDVFGRIDLAYPEPGNRFLNVVDHKSSSGREEYVKNENQLATDPQAVIYSAYASANAESLGLGPNGSPVRFRLDYYWTKGQRGRRSVSALLQPGEIQEELSYLGSTAQEMTLTERAQRAADVEGNPAACGDFGACPHLARCRQSKIIPQGVSMSSTIDELRAAKAARAKKLASAPPPDEDAKPTKPPKKRGKPKTEPKAITDPVEKLKAKNRAAGRPNPKPEPETTSQLGPGIHRFEPGEAGSLESLPQAGEVRIELPESGPIADAYEELAKIAGSFEQGLSDYSGAGQLDADQLSRSTRGFNNRAENAGSPLRAVSFKLGEGAVVRYSSAELPDGAEVNPKDGPDPSKPAIPPAGPAEAPKAPPVPKLPDGTLVSKAAVKVLLPWLAELTEKDEEEVKARIKELAGIEKGRLKVEKPREIGAIVAVADNPEREACAQLGWPLPEDRDTTDEPATSNEGKPEGEKGEVYLQKAPASDGSEPPVNPVKPVLGTDVGVTVKTVAPVFWSKGFVLFIDCAPQGTWPVGEVINVEDLLSAYYDKAAADVGAAYYAAPEYREGQRRVMDEFIPDFRDKGLSGALLVDSRSPIFPELMQVLVPAALAVVRGF